MTKNSSFKGFIIFMLVVSFLTLAVRDYKTDTDEKQWNLFLSFFRTTYPMEG